MFTYLGSVMAFSSILPENAAASFASRAQSVHPYSYSISLRIWHPNIEPTEISDAVSLAPVRAWKAGNPRQTPKGTPLEGVYRETYWYTNLIPGGEHTSDGTLLEEYLAQFAGSLTPCSAFFARIRKEGGRVELHIGLYGPRNYGFELPPASLAAFAGLGVSLTFDVYPYPQNWR